MVYSSMRPVLLGLNLVRSMISMLANTDDTNSEQSSTAELRHRLCHVRKARLPP